MDEKKKQAADKPEKKLSRTALTFYIVGLFSIAVALILISYIFQVRSDRQLADLSTKLSDQQKVAQGVNQKVEDLQKQLDEKTKLVGDVKTALGTDGSDAEIAAVAKDAADRSDALLVLLKIQSALQKDEKDNAKRLYDELTAKFTAARLDGTAQDALLTGEAAAAYQEAGKQFTEMN